MPSTMVSEATMNLATAVVQDKEKIVKEALFLHSSEDPFALARANRLECIHHRDGREQYYIDGNLILTTFPYELTSTVKGLSFVLTVTQPYKIHSPRTKESPNTITDTGA